jgi:cytochrome c biogenesis protein CcdA
MSFSYPALFLAGVLTFLSPCILPLVPIYLATLTGSSATALRDGSRGKRLFGATLAFSLGLSVVFVTLGLAASAVGRTFWGHRALVPQLSGLAILLAGLELMGFLTARAWPRSRCAAVAKLESSRQRSAVAVPVRCRLGLLTDLASAGRR